MLGLAALLTTLAACGGPEGSDSLVEITPASPEVEPYGTLQFAANFAGTPDATAEWTVLDPNGGIIDAAGTYTAPSNEGTYTVLASLRSVGASEATQVRVKRIVRIELSPSSATIPAGASLALSASVSGSVKTVTWSIAEAPEGGAITAAGVYTAPQTAGTYSVVATSTADPSKSGVATITVTAPTAPPPPAPTVTIAVTPQVAAIVGGTSLQFAASVTGAADTSATWSVAESGGGTVSPAGLYSAPTTAGTYHVTAKSNADGSKTATAAVTVTAPPTAAPAPSGVGTGTTYRPSNITNVTGGGAMPSWTTNVVTAACAGNGVTDDTACLQAAANAARDQNRALVIPATSSFYRITNRISVYTSVGGVGGMPTIKQTTVSGTDTGRVLEVARGTTGWIYNLRLVGPFTGSNAVGEWAHVISLGSVNGVTVKGNLIENAMGDGISTSNAHRDGGGGARNLLIDGNTFRNPRRCGIAFNASAADIVIMNNVFDKQVNYVSGIDFEPEGQDSVWNAEVAYNKFVMNNRTVNPTRGADGKAVFGWQVPVNTAPGGNYYIHHNYGTFGTGFSGFGSSTTYDWGYIYRASNVEGSTIPN